MYWIRVSVKASRPGRMPVNKVAFSIPSSRNRLFWLSNAYPFKMAALPPFQTFSRALSSPSNSSFRFARGIRIAMGPCQFQGKTGFRCLCRSGECTVPSSDLWSSALCKNCEHTMEVHHDYGKHPFLAAYAAVLHHATDVLKIKRRLPRTPLDHYKYRDRLLL